jgi:hypothetical protein
MEDDDNDNEGEEEYFDREDAIEDGDEEDEDEQQPAKMMTRIVNGKIRKYNIVKTVKSMDELDKYRFKV